MSHIRELTAEESKDLEQWLKVYNIVLNVRTRREFSDAVPVAKICKTLHPKLVNIYNYTPRNSMNLKLRNWETFNSKVLKKLNLTLPQKALEQLASGTGRVLDTLLYDLMCTTQNVPVSKLRTVSRARSFRSHRQMSDVVTGSRRTLCRSLTHVVSATDRSPPEVLTLDVQELIDGRMCKVSRKLVPYELYQEAVRECAEKENYITTVDEKAKYLERVIETKEDRITDLMEQLGRLSVSILSMRPMLNENNVDDNDNDNENGTNNSLPILANEEPPTDSEAESKA